MSRQQILNEIIYNLENPECGFVLDNIDYFTRTLPYLIFKLRKIQLDENEKNQLAISISSYANYLASQIKSKRINTERRAYLATTTNKLCEIKNFEFLYWLEELQKEISLNFITESFTGNCKTRHLVQYFYQLTKLLKKNDKISRLFFEIKNTSEINEKINFILASVSAHPNSKNISATFLGLGYLAQQGKTYVIADQKFDDLLEKLVKATNTKSYEITNTLLGLDYLAQQGKTYVISDQRIKDLSRIRDRLGDAQLGAEHSIIRSKNSNTQEMLEDKKELPTASAMPLVSEKSDTNAPPTSTPTVNFSPQNLNFNSSSALPAFLPTFQNLDSLMSQTHLDPYAKARLDAHKYENNALRKELKEAKDLLELASTENSVLRKEHKKTKDLLKAASTENEAQKKEIERLRAELRQQKNLNHSERAQSNPEETVEKREINRDAPELKRLSALASASILKNESERRNTTALDEAQTFNTLSQEFLIKKKEIIDNRANRLNLRIIKIKDTENSQRSEIERHEAEENEKYETLFSSATRLLEINRNIAEETSLALTTSAPKSSGPTTSVNSISSFFAPTSSNNVISIFQLHLSPYEGFFEKWKNKKDFMPCIFKLQSNETLDTKINAHYIERLFHLYEDAKNNIHPAAKIYNIFSIVMNLICFESANGLPKLNNALQKTIATLPKKEKNILDPFAADLMVRMPVSKIRPNSIFLATKMFGTCSPTLTENILILNKHLNNARHQIFSSEIVYKQTNSNISELSKHVINDIDVYFSTLYSLLENNENKDLFNKDFKSLLNTDEMQRFFTDFYCNLDAFIAIVPKENGTQKFCYQTDFMRFSDQIKLFCKDLQKRTPAGCA